MTTKFIPPYSTAHKWIQKWKGKDKQKLGHVSREGLRLSEYMGEVGQVDLLIPWKDWNIDVNTMDFTWEVYMY